MRGPDRLLHGGARAVGASRAAKMENGARGPHGWQPVAANGSQKHLTSRCERACGPGRARGLVRWHACVLLHTATCIALSYRDWTFRVIGVIERTLLSCMCM